MLRTITEAAYVDAGALVAELNEAVRAGLRNRLIAGGGLRGTPEEIAAEAGLIFDRFLPPLEFASGVPGQRLPGRTWGGRRQMRVADRAAFDRWRAAREAGLAERREERARRKAERERAGARTLSPAHRAALETGWAKWYNDGVTEQASRDADVVAFFYTAIRDSRTCSRCRSLDGIIRPKADPLWQTITPPNHHRCRCRKVPITRYEKYRETPLSRVPKVQPAEGFGGTAKQPEPGPAIRGRVEAIRRRIAAVSTEADARRALADIDRLGAFTRERGNLQGRLERRLRREGIPWPDRRGRAARVADVRRKR
jgi:SPP1 gp7 family putative phage head morphogenesis protein